MSSEKTGWQPEDDRFAVRPSLPPLLWATVVVWVGLRIGEWMAWSEGGGDWLSRRIVAVGIASAVALAVSSVASGVARCSSGAQASSGVRLTAVMLGLALVCGIGVGVAAWGSYEARIEVLATRPAGEWKMAVTADARATDFSSLVEGKVLEGPGRGATVTVMLPRDAECEPLCGDVIQVGGRFKPTAGDYARNDRQRQVSGAVQAWSAEVVGHASGPSGWLASTRRELLGRLERVPGDGGALLAAMLAGYRGRVAGTQVEADFRAAGLSHVLAVSGTHLAVVAWATGAAASACGAGRKGRWAAIVGAALLFTLFTGAHASTVRASMMVVATCAATLVGRRHDALGALSATVLGMLLYAPELAFSVGLALSASAVAALVVFSPLAEEWIAAVLPWRARKVASAPAVALVAHTATTPIVATTFGTLATLGPLANIMCIPLVTLALWLGCVGAICGALVARLGEMILRLAGGVLGICAALAHRVAATPGAVVSTAASGPALALAAIAGMAFAWVRWPRPARRGLLRGGFALATCVALLPVIALPSSAGARIVVIDVGQGDAILVQDGSACLLVDTGEDPEVLRAALGRLGVRHLDAVVLTHAHEDHTGGLAGLRGTCSVDGVFAPEASLDEFAPLAETAAALTGHAPAAEAIAGLKTGDAFNVGSFGLEVLWPDADTRVDDTNDGSIVLDVTKGEFSALLTGDAENGVYERLAREDRLPRVDVLKVPHHGSEQGIDEDTLAVMRPRIAIISVGTGNDFGHPNPDTLRILQAAGCVVLRTDESGDVFVEVAGGGFEVRSAGR